MALEIVKSEMANALTSADSNHVIAVTKDVYDESQNKYQSAINAQVIQDIENLKNNGGGGGGGDKESLEEIKATHGKILEVQDIIQENPYLPYSDKYEVTNEDGEVICLIREKYAVFAYKFNLDGSLVTSGNWRDSYLYNNKSEDGSFKAKDNLLFYCKYLERYYTTDQSNTPIFLKEFLDYKVDTSKIATTLGNSDNNIISQKAVTDALALKADKLSLEEAISNKLSIVELSHLELIRTDTEDICFAGELGTVLDNFDINSLKNHTLRLSFNGSILYDSKINNSIYLKDITYLYLDFNGYHIAGDVKEYYFQTTVSNLNLKYGDGKDYKKYSTALITLLCDINAKTCELSFEDSNSNFDKIVIGNQLLTTRCELTGLGVNILPNTSKFYGLGAVMESNELRLGSMLGEGLTICAYSSDDSNSTDPIKSTTISRNGLDGVAREGIKFANGKIKFYHSIYDVEELPTIVTGMADPTTEFDAVNKRYIDLNFSKKQNTIVYDTIGQSLTNDILVLLDNTQTVITTSLDERLDFTINIGENTSLIFNTGQSVPSVRFTKMYWLKQPQFEPNSTYIFNFDVIKGTSINGQAINLKIGMWSKAESV